MRRITMLKAIWLFLACLVLGVTLFNFEKSSNPDIAQFLFYAMLVLSFPLGFLVAALLSYLVIGLHSAFGLTLESDYLSITLLWAIFVIVGYLQWFVLIPFIRERLRERKNNSKPKVPEKISP